MVASYTRRTLLTVICEASIEARGGGQHGERDGHWPMSGNVRIEILCEAAVADAIALHLQSAYFATYAMVCYLSDVSVLRSNKF